MCQRFGNGSVEPAPEADASTTASTEKPDLTTRISASVFESRRISTTGVRAFNTLQGKTLDEGEQFVYRKVVSSATSKVLDASTVTCFASHEVAVEHQCSETYETQTIEIADPVSCGTEDVPHSASLMGRWADEEDDEDLEEHPDIPLAEDASSLQSPRSSEHVPVDAQPLRFRSSHGSSVSCRSQSGYGGSYYDSRRGTGHNIVSESGGYYHSRDLRKGSNTAQLADIWDAKKPGLGAPQQRIDSIDKQSWSSTSAPRSATSPWAPNSRVSNTRNIQRRDSSYAFRRNLEEGGGGTSGRGASPVTMVGGRHEVHSIGHRDSSAPSSAGRERHSVALKKILTQISSVSGNASSSEAPKRNVSIFGSGKPREEAQVCLAEQTLGEEEPVFPSTADSSVPDKTSTGSLLSKTATESAERRGSLALSTVSASTSNAVEGNREKQETIKQRKHTDVWVPKSYKTQNVNCTKRMDSIAKSRNAEMQHLSNSRLTEPDTPAVGLRRCVVETGKKAECGDSKHFLGRTVPAKLQRKQQEKSSPSMAADAECASELTRTVVPEENNCLPFLKPGSCQTSQCTSVSRTTPEYIQRGLHESSERRRISDAVATETSNSVKTWLRRDSNEGHQLSSENGLCSNGRSEESYVTLSGDTKLMDQTWRESPRFCSQRQRAQCHNVLTPDGLAGGEMFTEFIESSYAPSNSCSGTSYVVNDTQNCASRYTAASSPLVDCETPQLLSSAERAEHLGAIPKSPQWFARPVPCSASCKNSVDQKICCSITDVNPEAQLPATITSNSEKDVLGLNPSMYSATDYHAVQKTAMFTTAPTAPVVAQAAAFHAASQVPPPPPPPSLPLFNPNDKVVTSYQTTKAAASKVCIKHTELLTQSAITQPLPSQSVAVPSFYSVHYSGNLAAPHSYSYASSAPCPTTQSYLPNQITTQVLPCDSQQQPVSIANCPLPISQTCSSASESNETTVEKAFETPAATYDSKYSPALPAAAACFYPTHFTGAVIACAPQVGPQGNLSSGIVVLTPAIHEGSKGFITLSDVRSSAEILSQYSIAESFNSSDGVSSCFVPGASSVYSTQPHVGVERPRPETIDHRQRVVTTTSLTVSGKCEASETKKGRGLSRPAGSLREYHANSANDAESRSSSCSFFCDNFQSPRCFTTADSPLLPPEDLGFTASGFQRNARDNIGGSDCLKSNTFFQLEHSGQSFAGESQLNNGRDPVLPSQHPEERKCRRHKIANRPLVSTPSAPAGVIKPNNPVPLHNTTSVSDAPPNPKQEPVVMKPLLTEKALCSQSKSRQLVNVACRDTQMNTRQEMSGQPVKGLLSGFFDAAPPMSNHRKNNGRRCQNTKQLAHGSSKCVEAPHGHNLRRNSAESHERVFHRERQAVNKGDHNSLYRRAKNKPLQNFKPAPRVAANKFETASSGAVSSATPCSPCPAAARLGPPECFHSTETALTSSESPNSPKTRKLSGDSVSRNSENKVTSSLSTISSSAVVLENALNPSMGGSNSETAPGSTSVGSKPNGGGTGIISAVEDNDTQSNLKKSALPSHVTATKFRQRKCSGTGQRGLSRPHQKDLRHRGYRQYSSQGYPACCQQPRQPVNYSACSQPAAPENFDGGVFNKEKRFLPNRSSGIPVKKCTESAPIESSTTPSNKRQSPCLTPTSCADSSAAGSLGCPRQLGKNHSTRLSGVKYNGRRRGAAVLSAPSSGKATPSPQQQPSGTPCESSKPFCRQSGSCNHKPLSVGLKPVPSGSGSLGEYKELYGNALPNFSSGPPGVKVKNRFQLLDSNSEHDDDDE